MLNRVADRLLSDAEESIRHLDGQSGIATGQTRRNLERTTVDDTFRRFLEGAKDGGRISKLRPKRSNRSARFLMAKLNHLKRIVDMGFYLTFSAPLQASRVELIGKPGKALCKGVMHLESQLFPFLEHRLQMPLLQSMDSELNAKQQADTGEEE